MNISIDTNVLRNKKILFCHQSVGQNIMDGLDDILRDAVQLDPAELVSDCNGVSANKNGLVHCRAGKNYDPLSKFESFKTFIERDAEKKFDFALLKLCYVDVEHGTNIDGLFRHYVETVDSLALSTPNTNILHITVPLKVSPISIKTTIKAWIGVKNLWECSDNMRRYEYNRRLIEKYGKQNVFDLASAESTREDGSVCEFSIRGTRYRALLPEFTYDGGHLNDSGRKIVARRFLQFLNNRCRDDFPVDESKR